MMPRLGGFEGFALPLATGLVCCWVIQRLPKLYSALPLVLLLVQSVVLVLGPPRNLGLLFWLGSFWIGAALASWRGERLLAICCVAWVTAFLSLPRAGVWILH